MANDARSAALVTFALLALLLAASLMPAAGLGSFPSISGGESTSDGTVPENSDDQPATAPDTPPTVTTPQENDEERVTLERTTTTTTEAATGTDYDDDQNNGIFDAAILSLLVVGTLAMVSSMVVYSGMVLITAGLFGEEVAGYFPFSGKIRAIPQFTLSTLIGGSSLTASVLGQLGTVASGFGSAFSGLGTAMVGALKAPAIIGRGLTLGLGGSLSGALSNLSLGFSLRGGRDSGTDTATDARTADDIDPEAVSEPDKPLFIDAWEQMVERLGFEHASAKTPRELAREAVDRGWPEGPVDTLTSTFEEIRYGNREESADRAQRIRSALDSLRRYWGES